MDTHRPEPHSIPFFRPIAGLRGSLRWASTAVSLAVILSDPAHPAVLSSGGSPSPPPDRLDAMLRENGSDWSDHVKGSTAPSARLEAIIVQLSNEGWNASRAVDFLSQRFSLPEEAARSLLKAHLLLRRATHNEVEYELPPPDGDVHEIESLLREALARAPGNPALLGEAAAFYKTHGERFPDLPAPLVTLMNEGPDPGETLLSLLRSERIGSELGLKILRAGLRVDPENPVLLAEMAQRTDDSVERAALYRAALVACRSGNNPDRAADFQAYLALRWIGTLLEEGLTAQALSGLYLFTA